MIRLLVCDDSAEARKLVRTMLAAEREIEIVAEAENGSEAIALALETSPDAVLMDVAMPVLDGIEATRKLRELLPVDADHRASPARTTWRRRRRCSRRAPSPTA